MLRKLTDIVLFVYIVSVYLFTKNITMYKVANMFAFLFIFLVVFDILVSKKKIAISYVIFTQALFILVCTASYFIAMDKDNTFVIIKTLINLLFLVWAIIIHIDDYSQLHSMLKYIMYSGTISSVYILANPSFIENGRLGGILGDQNHIALLISFSFVFTVYYICFEKKYIYIPMGGILFYCILLTGSRIALIFIVLSILLALMLKYKDDAKSMLNYVLIVIVTFSACYYLLFNVPQIYSVIGVRFQNLFDFVSGKGTNEGSIMTRLYYTNLGFQLFFKKPLLGYGAGNYSAILNQIADKETYSHNNYTELLVGTGLLGTIAFYLTYILTIVGLYRYVKEKNPLGFLFLSMIITVMIIGYAWVFYQLKAFYILLAIVAAFIRLGYMEAKEKQHKCM
jgi:O-antigen ligase